MNTRETTIVDLILTPDRYRAKEFFVDDHTPGSLAHVVNQFSTEQRKFRVVRTQSDNEHAEPRKVIECVDNDGVLVGYVRVVQFNEPAFSENQA